MVTRVQYKANLVPKHLWPKKSHWNAKIYTTAHHDAALLLELIFLAATISG